MSEKEMRVGRILIYRRLFVRVAFGISALVSSDMELFAWEVHKNCARIR